MKTKSKKKKKRSIFLTIILVIIYGLTLSGVYFVYDYFFSFPDVLILKDHYPVVVNNNNDSKIIFESTMPKNWVSLKKIPRKVYGAIIVSEDWAFFEHVGFDLKQIQESLIENLEKGKFKRGGSTITQQVVKNIFLSPEKNLLRKYKELIIATELEEQFDKNQILEFYLNIAEMGPNLYGLQNAAQYFFKKNAIHLTPKEAAFIAMILPSPKRYSISFKKKELTKYAKKIIESILNKMQKGGFISEETLYQELQTPLSFEKFPEELPLEALPLSSEEEFSENMEQNL